MNKFDIVDKKLNEYVKKVCDEDQEKFVVLRITVNDPNNVVDNFNKAIPILNDSTLDFKEKLKRITNVYLCFVRIVGIAYDMKEAEETVEKISKMYEDNDEVCPSFLITRVDKTIPIQLFSRNIYTKKDKDEFESSKDFTEMLEKEDDEIIKERIKEQNKSLMGKITYEKGTLDHYLALVKNVQIIEANSKLYEKVVMTQKEEIKRLREQMDNLLKENPKVLDEKNKLLNGT